MVQKMGITSPIPVFLRVKHVGLFSYHLHEINTGNRSRVRMNF